MPILSDQELTQLAGMAAFQRGVGYFHEGRVHLQRMSEDGFEAEAEGSETYRLKLWREQDEWAWECDCPAGGFCKHLVAASLAWREGEREPAPRRDELLAFLKAQPAERLAQWLRELADEDPDIEKRLKLQAAQHDPRQLKKALGGMLNASGFMDWRRNNDYARRLSAALALLESLLASDPAQCLALCDYALGRLLRVYGNSDDSSGALGERIRDFAELHRRAAQIARIDRKAFARDLFVWQQVDEWDFFPLENYWESLGSAGQVEYAKRVEAEFGRLPAKGASYRDGERWRAEFGPARRMEKLARMQRDFDTLLRVLSRDLSSGHSCERIVLACREFGRSREALQWAERGVKAHPDFPGLRVLLAEELQRAGMDEEALEQYWEDFQSRPDEQKWQRLKRAAGRQWLQYRRLALEQVQQREQQAGNGQTDVTVRLKLLMADGDLDGARELAKSGTVRPGTLETLAAHIGETHPKDAAEFLRRVAEVELPRAKSQHYPQEVERIARIQALAPGDASRQWLAQIKQQYRAKRKLMALLAERGL